MPYSFSNNVYVNGARVHAGTHSCREAAASSFSSAIRSALRVDNSGLGGASAYIAMEAMTQAPALRFETSMTPRTGTDAPDMTQFDRIMAQLLAFHTNVQVNVESERVPTARGDETLRYRIVVQGGFDSVPVWWWSTLLLRIYICIPNSISAWVSSHPNDVLTPAVLISLTNSGDGELWYSGHDKSNAEQAWRELCAGRYIPNPLIMLAWCYGPHSDRVHRDQILPQIANARRSAQERLAAEAERRQRLEQEQARAREFIQQRRTAQQQALRERRLSALNNSTRGRLARMLEEQRT